LVLCITGFNALGLVYGIRRYTVLTRLALSLPPALLLAGNALWAVAFGVMAIGLWWLRPWARWGTLAAITLYLIQFWIERLVFGTTDYLQTTVWFYVGLDVIVWAMFWAILWRPKVRRAFVN
jgi:hypothetical protein